MIASRQKNVRPTFGARLRAHPLFGLTVSGGVLLGLWYVFLVSPLLTTIRSDGVYNVATTQERVRIKESELEAARALVQQVQQIDADVKRKVAVALPTQAEIPSLLAMVDTLVHQAGMEIVALDVVPTKDTVRGVPGVGVLRVSVSVQGGDYLAFRRMLASFEHALRIVDVTAIAFHPQTASYTLTLRAYTLGSLVATVQ